MNIHDVSLQFTCISLLLALNSVLIAESQYSPSSPSKWDVIGPFPAGMREIDADPLNAFGGIFAIPRADNSTYPSELGNGGRIRWNTTSTGSDSKVSVSYSSFYDSFLLQSYGWSMLTWQGWAVGNFQVETSGRYLLNCLDIREFFIDTPDNFYYADFYGYGYLFNTVELSQGLHTMYVKLTSSVRQFGNTPDVSFICKFSPVSSGLLITANTTNQGLIQPDIVRTSSSAVISSPHFAFPVLNASPRNITVSVASDTSGVTVMSYPETLLPGQSSMISFDITSSLSVDPSDLPFNLSICLVAQDFDCVPLTFHLETISFGSKAYRFTFRDYDGSAQVASAFPPATPTTSVPNSLMVATHGAGVDGTSAFWTEAFNQQTNTWIVFPTGRRPWGYDWHGPSKKNVFNAFTYLASNLPGVPSDSMDLYSIDLSRILWTGHSMGGAGCWMLSTHYPDLALASAPVAGFIAIEKYVPYFLRISYSHIDTILEGLLRAAIAEYDTDLYTTNLVGVPLLPRYGSDDTNVPPWNSRRNARLVNEHSHDPNAVVCSEVPGEQHWWNTAMNAPEIQNFYSQNLGNDAPKFPEEFIATSLNPDSSGPRGSLQFLQFHVPFRMARAKVSTGDGWTIQTENLRRFGLIQDPRGVSPSSSVSIDGQTLPANFLPDFHYCTMSGTWEICDSGSWADDERRPSQFGPAAQVFEKDFVIIYGTSGTSNDTNRYLRESLTLANQWFLYSNANVSILADYQVDPDSLNSNAIIIGGPSTNSFTQQVSSNLPITLLEDSIKIGDKTYNNKHIGVQFLAPWGTENELLVLAGTSPSGDTLAFKSLPLFSGMTLPDYYVVSADALWQGDGGVLAAGFWSNFWEVDPRAAYLR